MRDWPEPSAEDRREDVSPFSALWFGDTSRWTAEDHAAANAERERDLAALADDAPMSTDYADGLAEGYAAGYRSGRVVAREAAQRARSARWAAVRRIAWEGATYGAAYMLGTSLAELVGRRRAVRS